jgi:hypothetical protein
MIIVSFLFRLETCGFFLYTYVSVDKYDKSLLFYME